MPVRLIWWGEEKMWAWPAHISRRPTGTVFVMHLHLCERMPPCSSARFNVCAELLIPPPCGSEDVAGALQSTTTCAPLPFPVNVYRKSIHLAALSFFFSLQALSADPSTDMAPSLATFPISFSECFHRGGVQRLIDSIKLQLA